MFIRRGCRPGGQGELKQFADIVYRVWLQKLSKLENVRTTDPRFLTSLFQAVGG